MTLFPFSSSQTNFRPPATSVEKGLRGSRPKSAYGLLGEKRRSLTLVDLRSPQCTHTLLLYFKVWGNTKRGLGLLRTSLPLLHSRQVKPPVEEEGRRGPGAEGVGTGGGRERVRAAPKERRRPRRLARGGGPRSSGGRDRTHLRV